MVSVKDGRIIIKHIAKPNKKIVLVNDNLLSDEMTDFEFKDKVAEEEKKRDFKRYGRDGMMHVWEREISYRGLTFFVRVNRYYVMGVPLHEMKGMNKLGKWAVVEYNKDTITGKIAEFVERKFDKSEFLWRDTLHTWNDNQSLKQMVEAMIEQGKKDVDWWLDEAEKELQDKQSESKVEFNEIWGLMVDDKKVKP